MAYQLHSLPPRDERSDENASSAAFPKNLALHHAPAPMPQSASSSRSAASASASGGAVVDVSMGRMSPSASTDVDFCGPREIPTSTTPRQGLLRHDAQNRHSGHHKSKPIAIASSTTAAAESARSGFATAYDDDLEEEEETAFAVMTTGATVSKLHQSLPSRLLRAPFLGSMPNDERNLLPPPMRLSDPDDTYDHVDDTNDAMEDTSRRTVNYGSLRESHKQGRFLDGPLGVFNERRRTGALVPDDSYVWNSRTTGNSPLSSSAPVQQSGLSIGERIQQQRKLQQMPRSKGRTGGAVPTSLDMGPTAEEEEQHSNPHISTLAALIEATSVSEYNSDGGDPSIAPTLDLLHAVELSDTVMINAFGNRNQLAALSSSLTGLQVLQYGLPPMCGMDTSGVDTLPLTETIAIFQQPSMFISGSNCSNTNATVAANQPHVTIDDYSARQPTTLDLGIDRDPDTDGAFDFDME